MLLKNLIERELVSPGTWVGIHNKSGMVIKRLLINRIIDHSHLDVIDPGTNHNITLHCDMIKEIDGMSLHRFCAQASLNNEGEPITGVRRRGRRPKGVPAT